MIAVVIPSYNEGEVIASLILKISEVLSPPHLIIVVDDSPNDLTQKAIESTGKSNLVSIHRKTKGGRGSAVIEGIKIAVSRDCSQIVEMDADFSHPPEELNSILSEAKTRGLDLLIGSRYLPESKILNWPLSRRIFSRCANWLARSVLRIPIHDYTNGYRCYSRPAAEQIVATCGKLGKGFIALSEILVNLYYRGLTVGERPTVFVNRVRGESSVNLNEITGALMGLFRIYGLKRELQAKNVKMANINN